jgi:replicative DNA helicase
MTVTTQNTKQLGKMPPQAIDLEEAVLGAMLIDGKVIDDCLLLLNELYFYDPINKPLFLAIKSLNDSNRPVDLLTVSEKLKELGKLEFIGGIKRLVHVTQKVASSAHVKEHCRIIIQKSLRREVISICSESISKAFDESVDVFDLLDFTGKGLDDINNIISNESASLSWYDAMLAMPKRLEFLTNNQGKITGIPTGLKALDKHFSGWQNTDFIVIGADSGMGKTALVMTHILAAAKENLPVGMFSMEMSVQQLAIRATAVESSFHMNQLSRTGFEKQEYFSTLFDVVDTMKDYPIHIDDKPALTVPEMKRKARALSRNHGIKILIIDFLQMFSGDKEVRINIGEAARECKNLAKELNIPVIALSQLSREVKKSQYSIPKKHHLKEASTIEEAADVIGLLYRPNYYGYTSEAYPGLYDDILGLVGDENAALMVVKNRNGSLGNVGMKFIEDKTKYVDANDNNTPF